MSWKISENRKKNRGQYERNNKMYRNRTWKVGISNGEKWKKRDNGIQ